MTATPRGMTIARAWLLMTAALVVVALAVQLPVSASSTDGFFDVPTYRALNLFAYFTVQSNVLVAASALLTALQPDMDTLLRRVLRLTALVAITVTGVVYHAVLAGLVELSPAAAFADALLHTAVPVAAVVGWLVFGPRGRTSWRVVGLSVVFPVLWLVLTLVRGRVVGGFWPYPFVDVDQLGLGPVLLNCAAVAVLFVGLAAAAHGLDRVLDRGPGPWSRPASPAAPGTPGRGRGPGAAARGPQAADFSAWSSDG